MNRQQQVKICKLCKDQKFDANQGIICGVTNAVPTFSETCEIFKPLNNSNIEEIKKAQEINNAIAKNGTVAQVKKGANWFYWIAAFSVINSLIIYSGGNVSFIVGLGTTQLIDGIIFGLTGEYNLIGFIPNILIAAVFMVFGYYSGKLHKWAFLTGIIIYSIDALIFLLVPDWLSIGFHVFAIAMIVRGYVKINEIETA